MSRDRADAERAQTADEALPVRRVEASTAELPLDPARLPVLRGGRPRKLWSYLGVFGSDVRLCAGVVRIAGAVQSFWAVHLPERGIFREHTALRTAVAFTGTHVWFEGRGVRARLGLVPCGERVDVVSRHGRHPVWTRKTPLHVRGAVSVDGTSLPVDAPGLRDDSGGHHARTTRWFWSAGCGVSAEDRAVTWNLVHGLHDDPGASERTVWIDGLAQHVDPVSFAPDLTAVHHAHGTLSLQHEAERSRHERLLVLDSHYRQPFGTATGTLPDGTALRRGDGVVEWHAARW
ncbi:DUF2804 family protein [Bounagaea algeriensis]